MHRIVDTVLSNKPLRCMVHRRFSFYSHYWLYCCYGENSLLEVTNKLFSRSMVHFLLFYL
jgi:hypothetical protein